MSVYVEIFGTFCTILSSVSDLLENAALIYFQNKLGQPFEMIYIFASIIAIDVSILAAMMITGGDPLGAFRMVARGGQAYLYCYFCHFDAECVKIFASFCAFQAAVIIIERLSKGCVGKLLTKINTACATYGQTILPLILFDAIGFIFVLGSKMTPYSTFDYHLMQVVYYWIGAYFAHVGAALLDVVDASSQEESLESAREWNKTGGFLLTLPIPLMVLYVIAFVFLSTYYSFLVFGDHHASSEDRGIAIYFCIFGGLMCCVVATPIFCYGLYHALRLFFIGLKNCCMWMCCPRMWKKKKEDARKAREAQLIEDGLMKPKDKKPKKKSSADTASIV